MGDGAGGGRATSCTWHANDLMCRFSGGGLEGGLLQIWGGGESEGMSRGKIGEIRVEWIWKSLVQKAKGGDWWV